MRGYHTKNYAEVTVRLHKNHILLRCKAYNAVALVDFTLSVMERYYRHQRLIFAPCRVSAPHLLLGDLQQQGAYIDNSTKECTNRKGEHLY